MTEAYRRADLRAFDLLRQAKDLIGHDYWLFFGITAVGMILGGMAPLGILLGPMMCGIYLVFRARSRREKVGFALLWKGFDFFAQSLIATLIMMAISLVVLVPAFVLYIIAMIGVGESQNTALFAVVVVVFTLVTLVVSIAIGAVFFFVYPLIADRGLSGTEAASLSFKAARANAGGVLQVMLLNTVLGMLGVMCCYVGVLFLLPFTMGATWLAYRQVFPEEVGDLA